MAKHVIFVLHGIGQHDEGWSKKGIDSLKKSFEKYDPNKKKFDDNFTVKELRYSDQFDRYWEDYDDNADKLLELGVIPGAGKLVNAVHKIATNKDTESVLRTHIGDVLLYAGSFYNDYIPKRLDNQIYKYLHENNFPAYSIIAHSLGTRVVHDMLQRSFTSFRGHQLQKKPDVLFNLANVTKLMSFSVNEFNIGLAVYPSNKSKKGACNRYVNAIHEVDPIAAPIRYRPDLGSRPEFKDEALYKEVEIDIKDSMDIDVHAFEHYLNHPNVYMTLFNLIFDSGMGMDRFTLDVQTEAVSDYRKKTKYGELKDKLDLYKQKLTAKKIGTILKNYADLTVIK